MTPYTLSDRSRKPRTYGVKTLCGVAFCGFLGGAFSMLMWLAWLSHNLW